MPIPNDKLNREWVDASSENVDAVNIFRPSLVAILAFNPSKEPQLVGTGFIIGTCEKFAAAITAKHVVVDGVAQIQRPRERHVPSSPFITDSSKLPSIDTPKLRAYWLGNEGADLLYIKHIGFNESFDLASAILEVQQKNSKGFKPANVLLETKEPSIGDLVHIVSLDNLKVSGYEIRGTHPQQLGSFVINSRVSIRVGTVTGLYPKGNRQYKWPCFTTSIPVEPGMSGGMVYVPSSDGVIRVCGVVSADASSIEARKNYNLCGESIIASAWTSLSLPMPEIFCEKPPMKSIYELMKAGQLPAANNIESIIYKNLENGNGIIKNINLNKEYQL